ncbi:MAG: glycosyltransferase family 1 protein [Rhodospirillales bacterium]
MPLPPCTDAGDRLIVCLSHLRWSFVHQRPQHLLVRAARGGRVLFVEEPVFEAGAVPRIELRPQPSGVVVCVPVLPPSAEPAAVEVLRGLLDGLLAGRPGDPLVLWYYTPMALAFTDHLAPDAVVYDCMDELSGFRGAAAGLRAMEQRLFDRADLVFAGGASLYEAKRHRHHAVHAFPSSIDAAHFARARGPVADPPGQAGIPRPRLGWFGVIDERMDLDLFAGVADRRPDWQLVMVGPVVKIDPASLPRRANVHWIGPRDYSDLPDHLAGWDVGIMPFALNEATRYISPTKTPEFLAAGVPVVSTPVADVARPWGEAGLVEIAATAEATVERAAALMARPRGPWLERVDRRLANMSWDRTWAAMEARLAEALAAGAPGAPPTGSATVAAGTARV